MVVITMKHGLVVMATIALDIVVIVGVVIILVLCGKSGQVVF